MARPQPGIYVLTDHDRRPTERLLADVSAALEGGASLVQFRDKTEDRQRRRERADALLGVCRKAGIPLVINDDPELCAEIGAHGVHLGREDQDPTAARRLLGADCLIGVSCYNELGRAEQAVAAGADYIAFGSVFPSATKPDAVHAPLALLEMAAEQFQRPVCAIGGIGPANIEHVAAAGASLAAVISSVWRGDPKANVARLKQAFDRGRN